MLDPTGVTEGAPTSIRVRVAHPLPRLPERTHGPLEVFACLWRHRTLVWQLTKREVLGRYRGSTFGLFWAVLQPLVLLGLYTFVFGIVFQARWGMPLERPGEFALVLFAGLVVYSLFSECVLRAPLLVVANPTYVKRIHRADDHRGLHRAWQARRGGPAHVGDGTGVRRRVVHTTGPKPEATSWAARARDLAALAFS